MMPGHDLTRFLAASGLILLAAACYASVRSTEDTDQDPVPDTTHDPPADLTPDSDPVQGPVTFHFFNIYDWTTMYVDWTHEGKTELFASLDGESFCYSWFRPPCTMDCEDIPIGECGCMDCDPQERVVHEIPPWTEVVLHWSGPDIFRLEEDDCGCTCARSVSIALPLDMYASFLTWSSYDCPTGSCTTQEDGRIFGAIPDGTISCHGYYFGFPILPADFTYTLAGGSCPEDWTP
jgi:hypothetical protein